MSDQSPLGAFLRSRRERLSPRHVGLPMGGRRRTPGLRREELAMLADISVDYLIRLEQGREKNPSPSVVTALGDALKLNKDERSHLLSLVTATRRPESCLVGVPPFELSSTTKALMQRLESTPAFVLEPTGTVLTWNNAYDRLMRLSGLLDLKPPNLLRYTFLMPAARSFYRDWAVVARSQVANLRASVGSCDVGGGLESLVGELSVASTSFARLWADHEVGTPHRGIESISHPGVGDLNLAYEVLLLTDPGERRLITYLPADEASTRALEKLLSTPSSTAPGLRVVDNGAA